MPRVAASAMYSKCIVSPLIRQPRQMTASKRPLSASRCAAIGSSNAPGTRTSVTSSSRTSASASASRAPASRPVGDLGVEAGHDDGEPATGGPRRALPLLHAYSLTAVFTARIVRDGRPGQVVKHRRGSELYPTPSRRPAPSSAPVASAYQSCTSALRPGTNDWCHSSCRAVARRRSPTPGGARAKLAPPRARPPARGRP